MGMSSSGTRQAVSEINVTPLIDVVLVLLIIFMVIVPVTPKGLNSLLPQPSKNDVPVIEATIVFRYWPTAPANHPTGSTKPRLPSHRLSRSLPVSSPVVRAKSCL